MMRLNTRGSRSSVPSQQQWMNRNSTNTISIYAQRGTPRNRHRALIVPAVRASDKTQPITQFLPSTSSRSPHYLTDGTNMPPCSTTPSHPICWAPGFPFGSWCYAFAATLPLRQIFCTTQHSDRHWQSPTIFQKLLHIRMPV